MRFREFLATILPHNHLNRSLRILIMVNTGMVFVMGLFAPFYAVYVEKIGGTVAFAGLSWAMFSVVAGVLILLFSKWELQVKEQELLLAVGYLIRAVVFLSYAFIDSLPQLMFTQVLWGVAAALGTPAFDAIYHSHTASDHSSIIQWGSWEGFSHIAIGLAALIGGVLIQAFGFSAVFIGMSLVSFALGLYVWKLPREVL